MTTAPALTSSTAAVVLDEAGRILSTRRADDGTWCMPGGRQEAGESLPECLRRECREELGRDVNVGPLLALLSDPATQSHRYPSGAEVQFIQVVFLVELGPVVGETDGEVLEEAWFGPDDLPATVMATDRPAIEHALSGTADVLVA